MTGLLAVYPIVMTSLMLIFQPRVGGPATAALIANTMWGLVGFSACLFTVHLAVVPLGTWAGLVLSLVVSVVWNLVLYGLRRRARAAARRLMSAACSLRADDEVLLADHLGPGLRLGADDSLGTLPAS